MLKHIMRALKPATAPGPRAAPATARAEAALRAGRPGEAVDIVVAAVDQGELMPEDCIALAQYLLAAQAFEEALRAATPPTRWSYSASTRLKFESHAAVARARRDARAGRRPVTLPMPSGPAPQVSVVICSIDPPSFERASRSYRRLLAGIPHEIVGVHDAKSLCEGNNRGARRARGDLLLFSHDDVEIMGEDFAARLLATFGSADLIGIAGTSRLSRARWITHGHPYIHGQHGIPRDDRVDVQVYSSGAPVAHGIEALDGVLLATRRELWEAHPFDEETFRDWHLYDIDFSYTAHHAGHRVAVRCDLPLIHYRRPQSVSAEYLARWDAEARRFLAKHPALGDRPESLMPDELCAVAIHDATEWLLLLEELYRPQ